MDYAKAMGCKCPRDPRTCRRGNIITNVVYDNACNLYHYILAREPTIARRFLFFVDRFHFKGHKNCSPYMSQGRHAATREMNSSANEQMNRLCTRCKAVTKASSCVRHTVTDHAACCCML